MLFNSIAFLIFLPIVIILYFNIKQGYRWIILLIASYYFYMSWKPEYAILIFLATLINYYSALKIDNSNSKKQKQFYLYFSLLVSLGILFIFKYFNFVSKSISDFLSYFSISFDPFFLNILLPVGISFYTFQTIGYTLDVYYDRIKPEKHFGIFALYVSFFPQLVAGPIERAKNLLPQFKKKHNFNFENFVSGLKLMVWGFFLKLVIADRLAIVVNQVYNNVYDYSGIPLILATYFFTFQIFADFAGYSFIAIGSAKILGFDLMENFKRPYFSKSISEFWRRWHISLSSWFKDYIYIPLGGNRVSIKRWYFNILIIFLVSGIWHGAGWTFIIWGMLHGVYIIFGNITKSYRNKLKSILKLDKFYWVEYFISIFVTFNLVVFAWIFFRANSLSDAIYIIFNLFSNWNLYGNNLGLNIDELFLAIFFILILEVIHFITEHNLLKNSLLTKYNIFIYFYYLGLIFSILLFGVFEGGDFIYFQF